MKLHASPRACDAIESPTAAISVASLETQGQKLVLAPQGWAYLLSACGVKPSAASWEK